MEQSPFWYVVTLSSFTGGQLIGILHEVTKSTNHLQLG
jgi:hypothetical protein